MDLLRTYCAFGDHRTGTTADLDTSHWLCSLLTAAGATVERQRFTFNRYVASATAQPATPGMHLEPLFYSATGTFECDRPFIRPISFDAAHSVGGIDEHLRNTVADARASGASLAIVPTECPNDSLCAINRSEAEVLDFPVCLAPGRTARPLTAQPPAIRVAARIEPAEASNITALFGPATPSGQPLVITTSYSGWFTCAGERGTGLAIAIALARRLASKQPVLLVLTSGHELGFLGIRQYLHRHRPSARAVFHIGSCVADLAGYTVTATGFCANAVEAITNVGDTGFSRISSALDRIGIQPLRPERRTDPRCWVGESEVWAPLDLPMLSIAGTSDTFHTPEDTFASAASPQLLTIVEQCFLTCAQAL
jgi:hypothetical protein